MDIIKIFGYVIAVCALLALVKQYAASYYIPAVTAAGCVLLLLAASSISPIIAYAKSLAAYSAWANIGVILKAVGIAVVSQAAQDLCRDSGHTSLAGSVALAGKLCMLIAAMPLFAQFADIIRELLA